MEDAAENFKKEKSNTQAADGVSESGIGVFCLSRFLRLGVDRAKTREKGE